MLFSAVQLCLSGWFYLFLFLTEYPQFVLFLRGVRVKSIFAITKTDHSDQIIDAISPMRSHGFRRDTSIESIRFEAIRLWALIFGLIFILFGFSELMRDFEKIYFHIWEYFSWSKFSRNLAMFLGGLHSIVYVIAIKFFRVRHQYE